MSGWRQTPSGNQYFRCAAHCCSFHFVLVDCNGSARSCCTAPQTLTWVTCGWMHIWLHCGILLDGNVDQLRCWNGMKRDGASTPKTSTLPPSPGGHRTPLTAPLLLGVMKTFYCKIEVERWTSRTEAVSPLTLMQLLVSGHVSWSTHRIKGALQPFLLRWKLADLDTLHSWW